MQAVQATHILAIGTGFPAPARRVGGHFHREIFSFEDHVAVNVGHRHFRGGNHIEPVERGKVHLSFLVGQLTGAEAGIGVDHIRRLVFEITGIRILFQEPGDQRALDLRTLALIDGETRARELHAQVKINDIEILDEFPVRKGMLRQMRLGATHFYHEVVFRRTAFRHEGARKVRKQNDQGLLLLLALRHLLFQGLGFLLQFGHDLLDRFSLIAASLLHQAADLGSFRFLLGQASVQFGLGRPALLIHIEDLIDNIFGIEMLDLQAFNDEFGVLAEEFEGQHLSFILFIRQI